MTKPHLKIGVDPTPKTLCKKQMKHWTQSNECILLIKHCCHKSLKLHQYANCDIFHIKQTGQSL